MTSFGQRFKQLRIEKEKTQEELAKDFNTTKSSISKYESNEQMPKDLNFICNYFNVTSDYLLGISDKRHNEETYKEKESFVIELLQTMKRQGLIDDIDNISDEMRDLIINAIKIEYKKSTKARD